MIDLPHNFEQAETEYNRNYDPYDTDHNYCWTCDLYYRLEADTCPNCGEE